MQKDFRESIRAATEACGVAKPDSDKLLDLIELHYDKLQQDLTQSTRLHELQDSGSVEAIFDSVTEALFSIDGDGVIRKCNKVCPRYFGVARAELVGAHVATILPAAKGRRIDRFLAPFITDLDDTWIRLTGGEVEALRASGETFMSEINASELATPDGPVYVISLRDVTERRQADTALRENEERYRALVENAPEAIIVFDVDENCFIDANDIACELFNLTRSRLLTLGPAAISPEFQADGTKSFGVSRGYIERTMNGGHPIFEWTHQDSRGRQFPCEVRFSRLPSDERRLIRVSISDITERKRQEAMTHAQNAVLEMIAASAPQDRTLRSICRFVEQINGDFKAAISRYDAKTQTLSVEQAPGLPAEFKQRLVFVKVDASSITAAAAVFHEENRVTPNIEEDAGWQEFHEVAAQHNIVAACSFLVYGAAGRIIGTLDIYLETSRLPTEEERDKLLRMARLAGIAIKRQQDEESQAITQPGKGQENSIRPIRALSKCWATAASRT